MPDLVEQIRQRVEVFQPGGDTERLLVRAANEIESLRLQVWEMERRIEWMWNVAPYVREYDPEQEVPWVG